MNLRANTGPPSGKTREPRAPQPSEAADLTCTIRTRFSSLGDLVKAMPILVREDGKLFVPAKDPPVHIGDRLTIVFATVDNRASVERAGIVESLDPDRALSGGQPGILFRMLPWEPPVVAKTTPPPAPTPFAKEDDEQEANPFDEEDRNPFSGLDTNMLSLFVECNLKESEGEVSRSYDDIPTYSEPGPPPTSATMGLPLSQPAMIALSDEVVEELEELPVELVTEAIEEAPAPARVVVPKVHPRVQPVSSPAAPEAEDWEYAPSRRFTLRTVIGAGLAVAALAAAGVLLLRTPKPPAPRPAPAAVVHRAAAPAPAAVAAPAPAPPPASPAPSAPEAPAPAAPAVAAPAPAPAAPAAPAAATAPSPAATPAPPPTHALAPAADAEPAPAPAAADCKVKIVSRPPGAEVWLAGRSLGNTPTGTLSVPCGAALAIKRPRYQSGSATPQPQTSGGVQHVAVQLSRPSAKLAVTSQPPGAKVRIKGRIVGTTPAVLTVNEYDVVRLEIQAPGFPPLKKQVYMRADTVQIHADLARPAASTPSSAAEARDGADGDAAADDAEPAAPAP